MDIFVESVYLKEILFQGSQALNAYERTNICLRERRTPRDIFAALDDFIDHCSRVSLLIWPPAGRKPKNAQQKFANEFRQMRGSHLSKRIGVDNNHPINSRKLRDHLHHFDERLDEIMSGPRPVFADSNIGPRVGPIIIDGKPPLMLRHFDPQTYIYSFREEEYEIREMEIGMRDILTRAQAKLF